VMQECLQLVKQDNSEKQTRKREDLIRDWLPYANRVYPPSTPEWE
jgi:hypothetical protein